jgi:O-antigen/teichoic acid export membrane protein
MATAAPPRTRIVRVVGALASVNAITAAAGLITGPLQARALGAAGRGDLAAILVPLTFTAHVLSLSIGAYASRETARGMPVRDIVGSLGGILIAIGLVGGTAGFFLADEIAAGRSTVETFLKIGFALMPLSLFLGLAYSMLGGLEAWRQLAAARLIPVVVGVSGIVTLYLTDALTVATAAAVTLTGSLASCVPVISQLRGRGWPRFKPRIARESVIFGLKTWVGNLAAMANMRLDQLVMIPTVPPRELGLYAVAVTLAGMPYILTGALGPPLITRVAQGDRALVPRALRVVLGVVSVATVVLGALTPLLLPLVFGSEFAAAIDMALVLLLAGIPSAGVLVLMSALVAAGRPGTSSIGELLALSVTGVGLLLVLEPLGGLGAALVSLAAYSANFGLQLITAQRVFGGPLQEYVVPRWEDARWLALRLVRDFRLTRR